MSCPTCGHTMQSLGHGISHCPRCGTVKGCYADGPAFVPGLVARCRKFEGTIRGVCAEHMHQWKALGVAESINKPEDRP